MPAASQSQDESGEELAMLLAGYRACASEAIRFLTEEEQVPFDSPLILGLWQHLLYQEARLDVDGLLSNHGSEADDSGLNMSESINSDLIGSDAFLPTETAQLASADVTDSSSEPLPYSSPQSAESEVPCETDAAVPGRAVTSNRTLQQMGPTSSSLVQDYAASGAAYTNTVTPSTTVLTATTTSGLSLHSVGTNAHSVQPFLPQTATL